MSLELLSIVLSFVLGVAILWQNHYLRKQNQNLKHTTDQIEINVNSRLDRALEELAASVEKVRTEGVRADVAEADLDRHHIQEDEDALAALQEAIDENDKEG